MSGVSHGLHVHGRGYPAVGAHARLRGAPAQGLAAHARTRHLQSAAATEHVLHGFLGALLLHQFLVQGDLWIQIIQVIDHSIYVSGCSCTSVASISVISVVLSA